jgi:hypothetical protein
VAQKEESCWRLAAQKAEKADHSLFSDLSLFPLSKKTDSLSSLLITRHHPFLAALLL